MDKPTIRMKRKLFWILMLFVGYFPILCGRIAYIQIVEAPSLQEKAYEQQTRDRLIRPVRGNILDRNGVGLAVTESVCAVSVIHAQVKDEQRTAEALSKMLDLEYDSVLEKVQKRVALVRIKSKVDRETAQKIRDLNLPGVVVDEDVKRVYPYDSLASQVIGLRVRIIKEFWDWNQNMTVILPVKAVKY